VDLPRLYPGRLDYCYAKGQPPATHIGNHNATSQQLKDCADNANAKVQGTGSVAGIAKHTEFKNNVDNLNNSRLLTEHTYLNGKEVPSGTPGGIRFDVVKVNIFGKPIAAWDLKTGSAFLSEQRIYEMRLLSGLWIPIYEIK